MASKPAVFLDTSAVFAGVWSAEGGARALLKLGEAGVIRLQVSPQVLAEVEGALRRKAPQLLGTLILLLAASQIEVTAAPATEDIDRCERLTGYRNDALILAAAFAARPGFFVTLDREHFLDNPALREAVPFPIGTPGDCLAWVREYLQAPNRDA